MSRCRAVHVTISYYGNLHDCVHGCTLNCPVHITDLNTSQTTRHGHGRHGCLRDKIAREIQLYHWPGYTTDIISVHQMPYCPPQTWMLYPRSSGASACCVCCPQQQQWRRRRRGRWRHSVDGQHSAPFSICCVRMENIPCLLTWLVRYTHFTTPISAFADLLLMEFSGEIG